MLLIVLPFDSHFECAQASHGNERADRLRQVDSRGSVGDCRMTFASVSDAASHVDLNLSHIIAVASGLIERTLLMDPRQALDRQCDACKHFAKRSTS
mmetsp:Transcript_32480/g.107015  ORF Transcript_32480/g.107015 Transcript_32480/m.107015 type:complete len:97 (-) Transcript_32480:37-327(-)